MGRQRWDSLWLRRVCLSGLLRGGGVSRLAEATKRYQVPWRERRKPRVLRMGSCRGVASPMVSIQVGCGVLGILISPNDEQGARVAQKPQDCQLGC